MKLNLYKTEPFPYKTEPHLKHKSLVLESPNMTVINYEIFRRGFPQRFVILRSQVILMPVFAKIKSNLTVGLFIFYCCFRFWWVVFLALPRMLATVAWIKIP